jgi:CRISPR/Cas system CSM-associated protein Csm4 (group 5 of RAMP superfamily)
MEDEVEIKEKEMEDEVEIKEKEMEDEVEIKEKGARGKRQEDIYFITSIFVTYDCEPSLLAQKTR